MIHYDMDRARCLFFSKTCIIHYVYYFIIRSLLHVFLILDYTQSRKAFSLRIFVAFYFSPPYHFAMLRPLMMTLILFMFAGVFPLTAEDTAYDVLITEPYTEESGIQKAIRFYQEHISQHDGARCLYYPTCSAFYRQAVAERGLFWGTIMIVDRMVYREDPSSMKHYEYIEERGSYKDPVCHNYIFEPSGYYE